MHLKTKLSKFFTKKPSESESDSNQVQSINTTVKPIIIKQESIVDKTNEPNNVIKIANESIETKLYSNLKKYFKISKKVHAEII